MNESRKWVAYSAVMSTIAVFTVLSSSAWAPEPAQLRRSSVDSRALAPESVKTSEIAPDAVKATDLGNNAIKQQSLATGSVGSGQVADGTLQTDDLSEAARAELMGATGAPGSVIAYAHVLPEGIDPAATKNIVVLGGNDAGVFCLNVTTEQAPQNVIATLEITGAGNVTDQIRATLSPTPITVNCGGVPGTDLLVETTTSVGAGADRPFYISIN